MNKLNALAIAAILINMGIFILIIYVIYLVIKAIIKYLRK